MVMMRARDWLEANSKTLICSAFVGEIDLLIASKKFPHIQSLGIGNLEAALSLQSYLFTYPEVESVIFFGSCGAYPWSRFSIGDFVSVTSAHNKEISATLGQTKQIFVNRNAIDFLQPLAIHPTAICNAPSTLTLLNIITPPSEDWKELGVENLELYGIAHVCEIKNIQLSANMSVTNIVGPNGSRDWQKNWRELSNKLQNQFLDL